jgi:hypothetical protein
LKANKKESEGIDLNKKKTKLQESITKSI